MLQLLMRGVRAHGSSAWLVLVELLGFTLGLARLLLLGLLLLLLLLLLLCGGSCTRFVWRSKCVTFWGEKR